MYDRPGNHGRTRSAVPPLKHRGLTLVELLVAISVLGFIAVLGWRGLDGIVRARITLTSDLEQTRGMQIAFAQMQSDCTHLASPAILPDRVPLIIEPGKLILVRTVYADKQPSRLQIVTYGVQDGTLTRRASAATRDLMELDALWRTAANGTDTTVAVDLQSGVSALTTRLWINGSGWNPGAGAVIPTVTGGTNPNTPQPTGLEVSLQLKGSDASLLKIFLLGTV